MTCTCHVHATERPGGLPALNLVRSDDCPEHAMEAERKRAKRAKARGWGAGWKRFDAYNAKGRTLLSADDQVALYEMGHAAELVIGRAYPAEEE